MGILNKIILIIYDFYCSLNGRIAKSPICLVGKTAIVTGGNSGIGFEICLNLASRGCRVIIADKDDSRASRDKIIKMTGNSDIVSKIVNLASFKSIRKFASEINSQEKRLDILINNAGIGASKDYVTTEDGLNLVMQTNYFGPFLLTHLLLDLLKKSKPSRIIFTSSVMAFFGNFDSRKFADFLTNKEAGDKLYFASKLATIVAADIFAEKLKGSGVTSNSLHPGIIKTNIHIHNVRLQQSSLLYFVVYKLIIYLFGKSAYEGSQTALHLALSEEVENVTGKFFLNCQEFTKPEECFDASLCKKIWEISESYVRTKPQETIK